MKHTKSAKLWKHLRSESSLRKYSSSIFDTISQSVDNLFSENETGAKSTFLIIDEDFPYALNAFDYLHMSYKQNEIERKHFTPVMKIFCKRLEESFLRSLILTIKQAIEEGKIEFNRTEEGYFINNLWVPLHFVLMAQRTKCV